MKLKKAAALVLASLLAAGTLCLTACGGGAETEATKQAILGDWVRTATHYDGEDEEDLVYCEVKLENGISDAQIKTIETAIKGMEGVSNCDFWPAQGELVESDSDYFVFDVADTEQVDGILAQIEAMDGVESVFTSAQVEEEIYGEIYLTKHITAAQLDAIKDTLAQMDTISEWNYYDVNEEIQFYKDAEMPDSEIRAMISRGELYSYFDITIPDAKDTDDIVEALRKMDGVEDVSATAAYFRFQEDGTVIAMDEHWYETGEEEFDSYSGILTGTYTVEGNTVRTKMEYQGYHFEEELVLQDGRLLQEYDEDGSEYFVNMTDVFEKM